MTASTDEFFKFVEEVLEIEITEWQKERIIHYVREKDAEDPFYPGNIRNQPPRFVDKKWNFNGN